MSTTFDVLFLGNVADLDPTEGNGVAENAGTIVGSTYGSPGDPLYDHIQTLAPGSTSYTGGANATGYDTDNTLYNEQFTIDGGGDQTMDAAAEYNATITYLDGTTAAISAVLFQDTAGNLYLAPEMTANADQAALEAQPIQSITLDALVDDNFTLAADRGVADFDAVVDGTSGDDSMGVGDTDGDGDPITTGDDFILAGDGNDVITAGLGDDSIDGGTGNDAIYGDGGPVRESLNYQDLTTAEVQDGVTVNTGTVDVTFSSPTETGITLETTDSSSPYTGGVVDDGEGVDPDSVLVATAAGSSVLGEYAWDFSAPVTDVSFNITDLDGFENIQILAYDTNGDPVEVILTPGANVTVSDDNSDGIDDLAVGSGSGSVSSSSQAVTVTIPGPVASIEAIHTTDNSGTLGIYFTEMFFTPPDTSDGDDIITGGAGDDAIIGGGGADTIDGGADNDVIYGDGTSALPSERLTNGDFDGDLSGWTIINPTGGQAPVYSGGDDFVRLNSADEAAGGDGISQEFGTVIGETYSTTVDLAQNGAASGNHTVLVEALDEFGTVIDSATTVIGLGGSDTVTLDFVATSETSEIRITNPSSTATVNTDVVITDVSVIGVDPDDVVTDEGDDVIDGGTGDDFIVGGGGADSIDGGADDDIIYGDGDTVRESLNWEDLTTTQVQDGVTVNTGNVDVTFSSPTETGITLITYDTSSPYTGGIVDDGSGVDPDSVMQSTASSSSSLGEYSWDFSEPVTNVSFNITDLDNLENIQILAYDPSGNPIEVILTPGANVSVSDSNGDGIDDLAEGSGNGSVSDSAHAVTVTIPGPVSSIEAIHTLDGGGNLGIQFTEMFFDAPVAGNDGASDTIDGGAGYDIIYGEGGDDIIEGGAGADEIYGGDGADTIYTGVSGSFTQDLTVSTSTIVDAGDGDDHVYVTDIGDNTTDDQLDGGAGNDTIYFDFNPADYGGNAGHTIVLAEAGQTRPLDGLAGDQFFENFENVVTGAGDDALTGNSSDNVLDGGAGDDTITGGAGNDTLIGGDGNDTFLLEDNWGSDTILGGNVGDEDTLDFSPYTVGGVTVTFTGWEDGTASAGTNSLTFDNIERIVGSDQGDVIDASADGSGLTLDGGGGADSITGGAGDDTIDGGTGDDTLTGGAGDDTFSYSAGDGSDTITDFNAGNTGTLSDGDSTNNDFIDLTAFYDHIDELHADQADDGILNQSNDGVDGVDYSDNTQFAPGDSLTFTGAAADGSFFTNENTGVICFVRGTRILTPDGEIEIQKLREGDTVITQDSGAQTIRWIGSSRVARSPALQPIRIARGALGPGVPNRTLFVSPQHRLLIRSGIVERMTGTREVFVPAKKLTDMRGIHADTRHGHVRYFHILCDNHEIVIANGTPAETLLPGPQAKRMMSPDAWTELTAIFPRIEEHLADLMPARPVIRAKQKDNLTRRHRRNGVDLVEPGS